MYECLAKLEVDVCLHVVVFRAHAGEITVGGMDHHKIGELFGID